SLAYINLGIRWLKARARTYGSRPDWVGVFGTSSGGHQALLAAMRPDNPDYAALPLPEAPQIDARVAFVVSGWGVLDRGDKVHLPPALVFGGDSDEWVPVETMQRLVAGWKKAGGDIELQFYKG